MKRGSIDLGANLTMIVIVGLLILGVALIFVLKFFGFAHEETPKSAPEIIFQASADNVLYPEGKEIKIHPGESEPLLVSVYNAEWSDEEVISIYFSECQSEDGEFVNGLGLGSIGQKIPRFDSRGYQTVIKVAKSVLKGNYICSMFAGIPYEGEQINTALPYHSRQISINVY